LTFSVYVEKPKTVMGKRFHRRFNAEFGKIHDVKFEQRVNYNAQTPHGEVLQMTHGANYYPKSKTSDHDFIEIPCHWDFNHMVETANDCVQVLAKLLNQKNGTLLFSANIPTRTFHGYKVMMSW